MAKKSRRVKVYVLDEYILEEKEKHILEHIKDAFDEGDINKLIKDIKKAERLIKRRERKITYRLINAIKRAKINVRGKPIDIFEKELLEKHQELYRLLFSLAPGNVPDDGEFPTLIEKALETEKKIIKYVEDMVIELKKLNQV